MAHQEEGWPLGLRPVNARIGGLTREPHHEQVSAGSISFSSLHSPSPSSPSSSDLDSQSMGSFFRDRGYTLGNLMGISSFFRTFKKIKPNKDSSDSFEKPSTSEESQILQAMDFIYLFQTKHTLHYHST